MRLRCEFKTEKIPMTYNMMVVSMIKEALKKSNPEYLDKIYSYKENSKNKHSKNMTFSVYMKGFEVRNDEFLIKDKVVVEITSPDYGFMVNLYNGIVSKKAFNYKNKYDIISTGIRMVPEKTITNDKVIMRTLSPIAVKSKDGKFLKMEEEAFRTELNYMCDLIIKNYRGSGLKQELIFEPVSMKKTVVKEEISGCTNMKHDYLYVNAYKGLFNLEGDKEDLNLLYQLGLGFRRNQGFGMVDIVE
ncbi:CRISPR-associated endoribonuclease Cas6 [Hathewaya proteolytica DSM 3090]|uniref:CRISPR-associated endoribonuclease Cas6 n=1 Tax=Hathewaya proteolytica DSM 3090 TaxID=1121331 RepID=A0A1M6PR55_9CLOT|nr:CRISPR-associated endoribonuclease Cas6 [Hathewaya proteolytica]SHK10416.1 CRISPR-associated endoribonuclease Cas6 [Hathewaya proteolytica DSM 3090]